jgi:hypothetical protein
MTRPTVPAAGGGLRSNPSDVTFDRDCTRCPRLAAHLASIRAERPDYSRAAGAALRRSGGQAADRRARPRHARRQPHRAALYRGLRRHPALPDPASARLRLAARVGRRRRWSGAARLPHHQRRQVPAAGEQARPPRRCAPATPTWRRSSPALPDGAVVLALGQIAHNAVLRALGLKQAAWRFGHGAEHLLPNGLRCWTPTIAAATTPRPGGSPRPCSTPSSRVAGRCSTTALCDDRRSG